MSPVNSMIKGVRVQASAIADIAKNLNKRAIDIVSAIDGAIASAIDRVLTVQTVKVLQMAKPARNREAILTSPKVTNHRKNYESYMLALVELGWLNMTLPDKPTSPNQQYFTTLKGDLYRNS